MSDFYAYSGAAGTGSGADWTNAFTTGATALAGIAAGANQRLFVADDHAESVAAAATLTSLGTAAQPLVVMCARRSGGTVPPVDADLRTTATISTTGANAINFAGYARVYGIAFSAAGGGTNAGTINFISANDWHWKFESCSLQLGTTSAAQKITAGASGGGRGAKLELNNTTVKFASTGQGILIRGVDFIWSSSTALASGSSVPTTLFAANTTSISGRGRAVIRDVDFTAIGANTLVDLSGTVPVDYYFENCKLHASTTLVTGTITGPMGSTATFVNCDSGNTQIKYRRFTYEGTESEESTIVRTSGSSDGTTAFSRKLVSGANSKFHTPLVAGQYIEFFCDTIGSVTVAVPVVTDNVTLTDADAWVEAEGQNTSGFPLGVVTSDRSASFLATPASQTTDSGSTWTTTGLTTPVKQLLSVTFTTAAKGWVRAKVCLAKASTTMYFDPKILSGSVRQWNGSSGVLINESVASGGSAVFPAVGKVHTGETFGPTGADYTGTRTDAAAAYVISTATPYGDPGSPTSGLATLPVATKVLTTQANYGVAGALTAPTYVPTATTDVALGVTFGPSGSLTGTYSGGGGGVTLTQLQSVIDTQTAALESNLTSSLTSQSASDLTGIGSLLTARLIKVPRVGQTYLDTNTMQVADADVSGTDLPAAVAAELADDFAAIPAATADKALGRNLAGGGDGGRTVRDALRSARNRIAFDVPAAGQFTVYAEDDATPAWTGAYTRDAAKVGSLTSLNPAGGSA